MSAVSRLAEGYVTCQTAVNSIRISRLMVDGALSHGLGKIERGSRAGANLPLSHSPESCSKPVLAFLSLSTIVNPEARTYQRPTKQNCHFSSPSTGLLLIGHPAILTTRDSRIHSLNTQEETTLYRARHVRTGGIPCPNVARRSLCRLR